MKPGAPPWGSVLAACANILWADVSIQCVYVTNLMQLAIKLDPFEWCTQLDANFKLIAWQSVLLYLAAMLALKKNKHVFFWASFSYLCSAPEWRCFYVVNCWQNLIFFLEYCKGNLLNGLCFIFPSKLLFFALRGCLQGSLYGSIVHGNITNLFSHESEKWFNWKQCVCVKASFTVIIASVCLFLWFIMLMHSKILVMSAPIWLKSCTF